MVTGGGKQEGTGGAQGPGEHEAEAQGGRQVRDKRIGNDLPAAGDQGPDKQG